MAKNSKKNACKRSMEECVTKNEEFPHEKSGRSKKNEEFPREKSGRSKKNEESPLEKSGRNKKNAMEDKFRKEDQVGESSKMKSKKCGEMNGGKSEKDLRRQERNRRKKQRRMKNKKQRFEEKMIEEADEWSRIEKEKHMKDGRKGLIFEDEEDVARNRKNKRKKNSGVGVQKKWKKG